jgi:hypothetical protein
VTNYWSRFSPVVFLSLWAVAAPATGQGIDAERYARVKAGYVLNLVRLTQWPESAFADEHTPITIQLVGSDDMAPFLRELIRDELIEGRRVVLRELQHPQPREGQPANGVFIHALEHSLRSTHLLFVSDDERARLDAIIETAAPFPVLTVSDIPRFAHRGGMIGLTVRDGRIGLDANAQRIEASPVNVSSRVLRLASIVPTDGQARMPVHRVARR